MYLYLSLSLFIYIYIYMYVYIYIYTYTHTHRYLIHTKIDSAQAESPVSTHTLHDGCVSFPAAPTPAVLWAN